MHDLNSTICLIGMPGIGKSKLGSHLATQFGLKFIDLDQCIEVNYGHTIKDIWNNFGELPFRNLERYQLLKALAQQPHVLSCGGGTPCFYDNMAIISKYSFCIYLKSDIPVLSDKMKIGLHPVFKNSANKELEWRDLLSKRSQYYERAHCIQNAFNLEPNLLGAVSSFCLEKNLIVKRT